MRAGGQAPYKARGERPAPVDFNGRVCYPIAPMKPYGKVNILSLLALAAIAGGIYAVIMFSGPVIDNMDVSEEVASVVNRANQLDDDAIKQILVQRLDRVGSHYEEQHDGTWEEVPGLGITNDNITVDRDTVQGTIRVRVDYVRQIKLKPTQAWHNMSFSSEKEGPVTR